MVADAPSQISFEGGTHNPLAPPYDFLKKAFVPVINRMGPKLNWILIDMDFSSRRRAVERKDYAFTKLNAIDCMPRGPIMHVLCKILTAQLPEDIAVRELAVLMQNGIEQEKFEMFVSMIRMVREML